MPTELPPRRRPSPGHPPTSGRFERWFMLGFALVVAGGFGVEVFRHYTPAKLSVVFFLVAWFPLLALHESGHALAAWLCGWRIERVVVGYGGAWRRFTVRGVPVQLGRLPIGGFVRLRPRHLRQVRLRSAFIYFMGPGAELLVLGALALVVGPRALLTHSSDPARIAAQAVAVAILVGAVGNLVPMTARRHGDLGGPETPNDGLGVILSFVWPRRAFEERLRAPDDDDRHQRRRHG